MQLIIRNVGYDSSIPNLLEAYDGESPTQALLRGPCEPLG
jgi:hypothetical protein